MGKIQYSLFLFFLPFAFAGCSQDVFFSPLNKKLKTFIAGAQNNNPSVTPNGTPSDTLLPSASPSPICDTFGGEAPTKENGLRASLTYLPLNSEAVTKFREARKLKLKPNPDPLFVSSFITGPEVVTVPNEIFLNQLNVTTRDFTSGFQDRSGTPLKNLSEEKLIEYFSLHIDSKIMLTKDDPEGEYQLGMIADDGVILSIVSPDGTTEKWVDGDGDHSAKMYCSSKKITLTRNHPVQIHIDYFQAPEKRIALMLLWRHQLPSGNINDCSSTEEGDDMYFKKTDTNPSEPQAAYTTLTNDQHWSVIPRDNFFLVSGTNTCVKP